MRDVVGIAQVDHQSLIEYLAREILKKPQTALTLRCISTSMWSLAHAGISNRELFDQFSSMVISLAYQDVKFDPQDVSMCLRAIATVRYQRDELYDFFADVVIEQTHFKLAELNALQITHILWAFAATKRRNQKLFFAIWNSMRAQKSDVKLFAKFDSQSIATLTWAFVSLNIKNIDKLLSYVADEIQFRRTVLSDFKPQEISLLLWSFASARLPGYNKVYKVLGQEICRRASTHGLAVFNSQQISNTIWAFAAANFQEMAVMNVITDEISRRPSLAAFKPQEIANIVWAIAKLRFGRLVAIERFGNEVEARFRAKDHAAKFTLQAIVNISWAHATMGVANANLFERFSAEIMARLSQRKYLSRFNPQSASNLLWAFATVLFLFFDFCMKIPIFLRYFPICYSLQLNCLFK